MNTPLEALTIAESGTESSEIDTARMRHVEALSISAPDTLTGTVTVEINHTETGSSGWKELHSNGTPVTVPAGGAIVLTAVPAARLRLVSSGAEAAARTFNLWARQ